MKRWAAVFIVVVGCFSLLGGAPVQAQSFCGNTYTVKAGDTLVSIAKACGLPNYVVLSNINFELSDPNLLRPGQVIRLVAESPLPTPVPGGTAVEGGMQPGGVYIVRKGDSLGRIAYLYNTTVAELYRVNPQLGGRPTVYTGQRIQLPKDAKWSKGWVGVSSLTPAAYSTIEARVVDFPSYTLIAFRLRYKPTPLEGDISQFDDPDMWVQVETKTDARGEARVSLRMPYWALRNETWVVEVVTTQSPEPLSAFSAVMTVK